MSSFVAVVLLLKLFFPSLFIWPLVITSYSGDGECDGPAINTGVQW